MRLPPGEKKAMTHFLKARKLTRKSLEASYRAGFILGIQALFQAMVKEEKRRKK